MLVKSITNERHDYRDLIKISSGEVELTAEISVPRLAEGIVVFCHGDQNGRHGAANRKVAEALIEDGVGAAVCNLLTPEEEKLDQRLPVLRFDVKLLARRLVDLTHELLKAEGTRHLSIAYLGASTAAAAALAAAAARPLVVRAVVSLGGLPHLAGPALADVEAPTLLIVGEHDVRIMDLNREALSKIRAPKALQIVRGGTHLFAAPSALAEASRLAREWFRHYLSLVAVTA